jgi:hypothetical protein
MDPDVVAVMVAIVMGGRRGRSRQGERADGCGERELGKGLHRYLQFDVSSGAAKTGEQQP